jgi:hypothetical protein
LEVEKKTKQLTKPYSKNLVRDGLPHEDSSQHLEVLGFLRGPSQECSCCFFELFDFLKSREYFSLLGLSFQMMEKKSLLSMD